MHRDRAAAGLSLHCPSVGRGGRRKCSACKSGLGRRRAAAQGTPWLARGQYIEHYGVGEAYQPVLETLGRLGRGPGGAELVTHLAQYAPTWLVQLPALLRDEELAAVQRWVQGATPARMVRELSDALEAQTVARPLVLVLEDLHWSDAATVELLAALARRLEPARLQVLGTYRPVEVILRAHPLRGMIQELALHQLCVELPLELLSAVEVGRYLAARWGGGPPGADLQELARALHGAQTTIRCLPCMWSRTGRRGACWWSGGDGGRGRATRQRWRRQWGMRWGWWRSAARGARMKSLPRRPRFASNLRLLHDGYGLALLVRVRGLVDDEHQPPRAARFFIHLGDPRRPGNSDTHFDQASISR
jgi:AAA ATPase domain